MKLAITNANVYVSIVIISTQDNANILVHDLNITQDNVNLLVHNAITLLYYEH